MIDEDKPLWSIAEGQMDSGKSYILRFRDLFPTEAEQLKYSYLIEITWKYQTDQTGMPSEQIYEKMSNFEDLIEEIEKEKFCHLVSSITGSGKKIWQIYTFDADLFMETFNNIMENKESAQIEVEIFQDEEWNGYKEVIIWVE